VREVAPAIAAPPGTATLDARGRIVTPGWIDLHVHVYPGVSHYGIEPDPHLVDKGVTTAVDAGSAGAQTFPGFRRYIIDVATTRLLAYLNISSQGMLDQRIGELEDLRNADVARAVQTVEANRDVILGIKVRLSKNLVGGNGLRPLHLAREAADAAGLPVMVHPNDAWEPMDNILAVLRTGDVVTHCYHQSATGVLDRDGQVRPSVHAAVEREVGFDVGHGKGSFSFGVARAAMAQGLWPHTISSDLHRYNVDGPVFDLATTVTKFLHLGLDLPDAVRKVTENPARVVGMDGLIGTLVPGACADLAVFDLVEAPADLEDAHGVRETAARRLVPYATVRAGRVRMARRSAAHTGDPPDPR
ncbi:MAG: amidohydrolase/deacetylase family metallohydrolase, partial [Actinobacteria bacterium]|nr:amidohydrolase/deacetylase family metallohydrolase [Actinomycetota bacterium]